ncbi:hypothetical protein CSW98_16845 [Vibrio sp. HA2012]|uniref:hypothetical protein n=1 Tax=Vibrio sp. HA2012 TaxID=1971595 RepID=UPI000C2C2FF4|nr:hypothetical protein [Vibrio sp. HA2012]PJC85046.1 hypothetical protein CSW98_16845 [Vibrio sp. HA2012]
MLIQHANSRRLKHLQCTLTGILLLFSLIPLTSIALVYLQAHTKALQEQDHAYLRSIRDAKHQQIIDYFNAQESYVLGVVRSELTYVSGGKFYGLIHAFRDLGQDMDQARKNAQRRYIQGSGDKIQTSVLKESDNYSGSERYRLLHERYHRAFIELLKRSDFDDILLVDPQGNVTYSANKNDDFGTNLLTGIYRNSNLGKTFRTLQQTVAQSHKDIEEYTPVIMSDFSGQGDKSYAWFAAPIIQQGYLHSYVLLRLPMTGISRIITDNAGNESLKTLLVGSDLLPRTLGITDSQIKNRQMILKKTLSGEACVSNYTNSQNTDVIAAYTPVRVNNHHWALLTEAPGNRANNKIVHLKQILIISVLFTAALALLTSYTLFTAPSSPLLKLLLTAEKSTSHGQEKELNQQQDQEKQRQTIRITLVETMNAALNYWEEATGYNKFDLAEQSGLWRVYLDRGTLQTRTLDKYLHLKTLPKSPRWRTVLKSADFILTHCTATSEKRKKLCYLYNKLQDLLG